MFHFWSVRCSVWSRALLWRIGPLCWPVLAAGIVFSASRQFAEHTSQMRWLYRGSAGCDGPPAVDQQQTTKEWPWSFGVSLALGSALELLLSPATELVISGCHTQSTFCHISQSDPEMAHCIVLNKERWHFKMIFFFLISGQLMRHPIMELLKLSNLLQILNNCKVVDVEFFRNFSCSCKRIIFDDGSQLSLSTPNGQPLCASTSRLSSPLQNLNHHCTVCSLAVPGWNA